jgi:hypothetical protein
VTAGVHVIACGALGRELLEVVRISGWQHLTVEYLPPELHNDPRRIPELVRARIRACGVDRSRILVGYADCGTGGLLDVVCAEEGVERLPGAHCYELFAGASTFAALHDEEPGTFYLTDFLVRNVDRLVVRGLGLDRHPELRDVYFANYRRLVYLAQSADPGLDLAARGAAQRLGLDFERRDTGLHGLAAAVAVVADLLPVRSSPAPVAARAG